MTTVVVQFNKYLSNRKENVSEVKLAINFSFFELKMKKIWITI